MSEKEILSLQDVAELFCADEEAVRGWADSRRIPSFVIDGHRAFRRESLLRLAARLERDDPDNAELLARLAPDRPAASLYSTVGRAARRLLSEDSGERIIAAWALGQIAKTEAGASEAIGSLLSASLQRATGNLAPRAEADAGSRDGVTPDVQALLSVLVDVGAEPLDLRGARLGGVDLRGASLRRVRLMAAHLDAAILEEADFEGGSLRGASARSANLRGANLGNVNLDGADLTGADLTNARLDGASLDGTILQRARFDGSSLQGARLATAVGLRAEQLRVARCDETTQLPGMFVPTGKLDDYPATQPMPDEAAAPLDAGTTEPAPQSSVKDPDGTKRW